MTTLTDSGSRATAVRVLHAKEHSAARLVCFPHAGGAVGAFTALSAALPDDIELLAVQYPGRQDRRAVPCAADLPALARAAAGELAGYADRPLFLLGHSMGALVAFETARLLERQGAVVARLFASAARPPADDWQERDLDACRDDEIVVELRRLGGIPAPLLDEEDVVREVLRLLRADHRALRRYRCPPDATVAAPLTVLLADADPKNTAEQVRGWARHTTGGFALDVLPGGHFALTEGGADLADRLTRHLRADLASAAGRAAAPRAALVRDIYLAGTEGRTPDLPTDPTALPERARAVLSPAAYGYVAGDAGTGTTGRHNREAFARHRLVPRVLRGAARPALSVSLFGQRLSAPLLLAPIAAQTVVHPDGELATVRAAAATDIPFVLSTGASHSLEEVAAAAGGAPRWFQLYWPADREVAASLVRRAEESGYTALVLTVDAPSFGYRPADLDHGYLPFLNGAGTANFTSDPAFRAGLPDGADQRAVTAHWARVFANPTLSWDDLPWLRARTSLPILLKGVLHPDDARRALDLGIDGLVVSNHGGRQLDGALASLDALPAVRAAAGADVPILLDSGVRTGSDVLKALALGANAVLYGRPYLYGLALDGRRGVDHVLRCLLADLELALTLTGCPSAAAVPPDLLAPQADHIPQRLATRSELT